MLGAAAAAAALVSGPVAAATAAPAPEGAPAATQGAATQAAPEATGISPGLFVESRRRMIIDMFDKTNAFRASKGLKRLRFNVAVSAVSQKWNNRMASSGMFHHNPDFTSAAPAGYDSASENIAWSSYPDPSGKDFVEMWIASPGHNANMSRPGDDYLGLGATVRDGRTYATQNFFSYPDGFVPAQSYTHPRDYFSGRPALRTSIRVDTVAADPAAGTYTIPKQTGAVFTVNGKAKKPGTYRAYSRKITITLKASPGYKVFGAAKWSHDFRRSALASAPSVDTGTNRYTIPKVIGVAYFVNGKAKKPGTYTTADGRTLKFTVKASPSSMYSLVYRPNWTHRF